MRRQVPFGHGQFVTRCVAAHRLQTPKRPLCGGVQYCVGTSVRRVDTEPGGARSLAMMAACPARRDPPNPDVRAPIELPHRSGEALPLYQPHGPREECGVVGIWWPGASVARTTFVGLHALQHRGQESAGIAVSDGSRLSLHKRLGLVSQVFDEETIARLERDEG